MPFEFKDYYRVLGVPRTASADEIRQAFRKLARQFHPDVAKHKTGAEEKFKEINEAYEVLGDPEKRRRYDQLGSEWRAGARPESPRRNTGSKTRPSRTEDSEFSFDGTGFSRFFEQFFGRRATESDDAFSRGTTGRKSRVGRPGADIQGDILVTLSEVLR